MRINQRLFGGRNPDHRSFASGVSRAFVLLSGTQHRLHRPQPGVAERVAGLSEADMLLRPQGSQNRCVLFPLHELFIRLTLQAPAGMCDRYSCRINGLLDTIATDVQSWPGYRAIHSDICGDSELLRWR